MKNRLRNVILSLGMIVMLSWLAGCSSESMLSENDLSLAFSGDKPQASKTYEAFLTNSIEAAIKAVGILSNYINFENNPEARSRAASGGFDFLDVMDLVDSQKLSLMAPRSRNGETVSLETELDEVVNEYEAAIEQAAPDPTTASLLDGVELDGEGGLLIGGDMVISPNTIDGALAIELLNAEARGEDVDKILAGLDVVTEEVASNYNGVILDEDDDTNAIGARGLYMANVRRWRNNIISYKLDNSMSPEGKNAVLEAMRDWENKTGRAISFVERDNPWYAFLADIGIWKILEIKEAKLGSIGGGASVGAVSSSIMTLDTKYATNRGTIRHELGHVLGLLHEQQRGDRDNYINIDWFTMPSSSSNQYIKIDFNKVITRSKRYTYWTTIRIRILFWTVYIPVRRTGIKSYDVTVVNSIAPTPYDIFSVMHYENYITSKVTIKYNNWGIVNIINAGDRLARNHEITEYDARAVQQLYQ